ncbi:Autotransporter beta-domain protein [compost metagenome]
MDSDADAISQVSFDSQEQLTGRLGARLKGAYRVGGIPLEPYLRTDLWHAFGGHDTTTFASTTAIRTDRQSSSFEVGGGISARVDEHVSIYLAAGYSGNLDSLSQEASQATLGVRASW